MKFLGERWSLKPEWVLPFAVTAAVILGVLFGWNLRPASIDTSSQNTIASAGSIDDDGSRIFTSLAGPFLSRQEIDRQDRAANDVLHCRGMAPKLLPDGTKEFDLTASPFTWQLYNTARVTVWGYNRQVPGPLIRVRVGDRVRFVVKNDLPQATTIHWHGLAVPNAEDGVPGITQRPIPPGGTFTYHFTITPQMIGTHLYHTHFNDSFQMDMGLHGVFLVDPARAPLRPYGVEALYEMASFKVGGSGQENVFTLDGKAFPEAPVLRVSLGARVLIHLVNSSAENDHVMHLHGYTFQVVALDGSPLEHPYSADTLNMGPSQTADIAFTATNPGRWMFHCHILDHMINPSPQGEGSADMPADMGGLMTYIDVVPPREAGTDFMAAGAFYSDPNGPLCHY